MTKSKKRDKKALVKDNNGKKISLLRRVPIGYRLLGAFTVLIALTIVVGIFGILSLRNIADLDKKMFETMTLPLHELGVMGESFEAIRGDIKDAIMSEHTPERQKHVDSIYANADLFISNLDSYKTTLFSDEGRQLEATVRSQFADYMEITKQAIVLAEEGRRGEATRLMNADGFLVRSSIESEFARMAEIKLQAAQETVDNNSSIARASEIFVVAVVGASILVALIMAILVSLSITRPVGKTLKIIERMAKGHFDTRLNLKTGDQIGRMGHALDQFSTLMQHGVFANMRRIADGDVSMDFPKLDDNDEITPALQTMVDSIREMAADTNRLVEAAVAGDLSVRANADKHSGEYRKIVEGINATLDAVVDPIEAASDFMNQMAEGRYDSLLENKHQGSYAKLIDDINKVVTSLNIMKSEMDELVENAIGGNLSHRADSSALQGNYAVIVGGVNDTLDAVIKPVEEASEVLSEMAIGNLEVRVTGDYKGDHAKIKEALNATLVSLGGYIEEISTVLSEISRGNLALEIDRDYLGDFGQIKLALNLIITSLNSIIGEIRVAADQVAAGSKQVSQGSQTLSQGTTEQASSIEELTATITQIASQTRQNATSAGEANSLSAQARDNAKQGNSQMQRMIEAMNEISESSNSISKIIKVIDDIAFQTNILALNAAVEAARAGQHGKGFAVVAEEVRNLAARSAEAARETTLLIEGSIAKVGDGNEIADETAKSLEQIVVDVTRTAEIISNIAYASNEQASGLAQINEGVAQVSNVVQSNSATAEESAAASEELSSQAQLLNELTGRFQLS